MAVKMVFTLLLPFPSVLSSGLILSHIVLSEIFDY